MKLFRKSIHGRPCYELVQEIQSYKKSIWEDFLVFFDCSYYCSFPVMKLLKLIRYVVALLSRMNEKLQSLKKKPINANLQLHSLQKNLHLFERILALYSEHCIREFNSRELQCKNIGALGEWVWIAASSYLLNWSFWMNEYLCRIWSSTKSFWMSPGFAFLYSSIRYHNHHHHHQQIKISRWMNSFRDSTDFKLRIWGDIWPWMIFNCFAMGMDLLPQPEFISLDVAEMNEAIKQAVPSSWFLEMVDKTQAQVKKPHGWYLGCKLKLSTSCGDDSSETVIIKIGFICRVNFGAIKVKINKGLLTKMFFNFLRP